LADLFVHVSSIYLEYFKMRILHLSSTHPSFSPGGVPSYVDVLMSLPEVDGIVQSCICIADIGTTGVHKNGNYIFVNNGGTSFLSKLFKLFRYAAIVKKNLPEFDLVCIHNYRAPLFALPFIARKPLIIYYHGPSENEALIEGKSKFNARLKGYIELAFVRSAKHVVTLSSAFADIFKSKYGENIPITVIPGHLKDNLTENPVRELSNSEISAGEEKIHFVVCRRLVLRMGIADLIIAVARLLNEGRHNIILDIIGTGPEENNLKKLVKNLKIEHNVIFHGKVSNDLRTQLLSKSVASIVPTIELEGFGMVVLEAAELGLVSLVRPVGGLPEAASLLGMDKYVIEDMSVESLTDGLRKIVDNKDVVKQDGARAKQLAYQNASITNLIERHKSIYHKVMNIAI